MPALVASLFDNHEMHRHRDEISKIPMYADSIVKMLKDIRKTVRASAKLQPGSNAFAQFLDEVMALRGKLGFGITCGRAEILLLIACAAFETDVGDGVAG